MDRYNTTLMVSKDSKLLISGILSPSLSYRMQNTLLNYNKLAYDQSSSRKTKHKYLLMLLICRIS